VFVLNRYRFVLAHSEIYRILFDLMNYGMTNRVGPVFSEKMKNASTHHEIEYAEFIKSKIFVRSQRPRGRAVLTTGICEPGNRKFSSAGTCKKYRRTIDSGTASRRKIMKSADLPST
jgi:hypothetical protein